MPQEVRYELRIRQRCTARQALPPLGEVMPLNTPGGPVSGGQYAVAKQLSEIWFRRSEDATEPGWQEVVETALEMNWTWSEPAELELPAEVFAD